LLSGMSILEVDDKGRIMLPKRERERMGLGKRVLVINAGDHLKVIPLPADPLGTLDGVIRLGKPFAELRRGAEELARREAERDR